MLASLSALLVLLLAPALAQAQSWTSLTATTIQAVCPPNGFGGSGYQFFDNCRRVSDAWSGGTLDPVRQRLMIFGGGHTDYGGNEIYALDASLATPTMTRLNNPTLPVSTGTCQVTGLNPTTVNGIGGTAPNSRHTYAGVTFVTHSDEMFIAGGSLSSSCGSEASPTTNDMWLYKVSTGVWRQLNPTVTGTAATGGSDGTSLVYFAGHQLTYMHHRQTGRLYRINTAGNGSVTSISGVFATSNPNNMAFIDPKRQRYIVVGGGEGQVHWIDLNGAETAATNSRTWNTQSVSGSPSCISSGGVGAAYDYRQDRYVLWCGGTAVDVINPNTWVNSGVTVSSPPALTTDTGTTFGRFQYNPQDNAFYYYGNVSANAFRLRLTAAHDAATSDFWKRATGPGVVTFEPFDDTSLFVQATGGGGYATGLYGVGGTGALRGAQDTTTKASSDGALRFSMPANAGSNDVSGYWQQQLKPTFQSAGFGPGETMYIQFAHRLSTPMQGIDYKWFVIYTQPGGSCTANFVMENNFARELYSGYVNCSSPEWARTSGGTNYRQQGATFPSGLYNCPFGTSTEPPCLRIRYNKWVWILLKLQIGTYNSPNSTLEVFQAEDGQPYKQFINLPNWTVENPEPGRPQVLNTIQFVPYIVTGDNISVPWTYHIDEIIVSTQSIAAPSQAAVPPPPPTLTVTKAGPGSGTVTSSPAGISCGATCASTFTSGIPVTLTATPAVGSTFTGWSGGGCSGTSTCVVTLTTDTTVTPTFALQAQQFGLDWDGSGSTRRMMYYPNPPPIYPWTYVFKAFPRKKTVSGGCSGGTTSPTGYYTMFFWGNNGDFVWAGHAESYYGMHPYPAGPEGGGAPKGCGRFEISVYGEDPTVPSEVVWDRWYTQVIRVRRVNATTTEHEFYWDWNTAAPPTTCNAANKCLSRTINDATWNAQNPPNPAIVIGQAPDLTGPPPANSGLSWGGYAGWEEYNGILRGFQFYTSFLSLADINTELNAPKSSAAGLANIWYLNLDPRPLDVTDKKATGTPHNFQFGCPAIQTTCNSITEYSATIGSPPLPPTGLQIRP